MILDFKARKMLEDMKKNSERLRQISERDVISRKLCEYFEQLYIIDFCSEEATNYAQTGNLQRVGRTLADAKIASEAVYGIYVAPLMESGQLQLGRDKLPVWIKGLREHARDMYEKAVRNSEFWLARRIAGATA